MPTSTPRWPATSRRPRISTRRHTMPAWRTWSRWPRRREARRRRRRRHRQGPARQAAQERYGSRADGRSSARTYPRRRRVKITRFHHVSVNSHDASLSDMVSFYDDLFGLDSKERPEIAGVPGHWFHVADQELHVVGAPPRGTAIDS